MIAAAAPITVRLAKKALYKREVDLLDATITIEIAHDPSPVKGKWSISN